MGAVHKPFSLAYSLALSIEVKVLHLLQEIRLLKLNFIVEDR